MDRVLVADLRNIGYFGMHSSLKLKMYIFSPLKIPIIRPAIMVESDGYVKILFS